MTGQSFQKSEIDKICNSYCIRLATGQVVHRHVCDDCPDCSEDYELEYFTDEQGNKISPPDLTDSISCSDIPSQTLDWFALDTDLDGDGSIPAGAQSWSIAITDSNGPSPLIGFANGVRSIPPIIGSLNGNGMKDNTLLGTDITYVANGNRLIILYALNV